MGKKLPGDPKDVHVNVILNSVEKGDFRIEPNPPDSLPKGTKGALEFENKGHSGFWIYFHLQDPNKLNYKFPTDNKLINDTVWSALGEDACPETPIWEVFTPRRVTDKGMTLVVRNPNIKPDLGKFGYTLRVTKDGGTSYLDLDPGGNNKNGPIAPFMASWITPTLAGAIVAAGTVTLVSNSFVPATVATFAIGGAVVGLVVGLLLGRR